MADSVDTALVYQVKKQIGEDHAAYYLDRLAEFEEGKWCYPTNAISIDKRGNSFSIFSDLEQKCLVMKKTEPIWRNGIFKGQRAAFLWRHDLMYTEKENAELNAFVTIES